MPGSCLSHILLCALLEQLCVNVTFAVCVSACFPVQEVCVCMVAHAIRRAFARLLSSLAAAVVPQLHSISTGIWQGQLDWHGAHVNGPCLCLVDISDNETLYAETAMTKQSKATLSGWQRVLFALPGCAVLPAAGPETQRTTACWTSTDNFC